MLARVDAIDADIAELDTSIEEMIQLEVEGLGVRDPRWRAAVDLATTGQAAHDASALVLGLVSAFLVRRPWPGAPAPGQGRISMPVSRR
jgi:hypothetical protein